MNNGRVTERLMVPVLKTGGGVNSAPRGFESHLFCHDPVVYTK